MKLEEALALQAAAKKKGRDKYKAKKTVIDDIEFASGEEGKRYCHLKLRQRIEEIRNLVCHVKYSIDFNGVHICTYTSDFEYEEWICGGWVKRVEDYKSKGTKLQRDWTRTKKLMRACHGITIFVSGADTY